ncbi:MAG: hypothetical protein D6693_01600 [Planctomycetota bacterium]|nr:MAG: hypothetical protein D6693_01600 [Planctomycetota bacterium]
MAKGQDLSEHQRGIVKRYYEHLDTIALTRLGEIVSELYLAESPKKREALWTRARRALEKVAPNDPAVGRALESRDVATLAALVNRLSGPGGGQGARAARR